MILRLLALGLLVGAVAGFLQEPPEFPNGTVCTPDGVMRDGKVIDRAHPCHCKNMADPKTSCETRDPAINDPICSQYCHEQHCLCPMACPDGKH